MYETGPDLLKTDDLLWCIYMPGYAEMMNDDDADVLSYLDTENFLRVSLHPGLV